ncbi:MAG: sulfotransferase family protein [Thermodesulfobacteriota bacterium]|nr:sulfotransferase family protein [Thermodesulfobacteriota bacterium]
MRIITIVSGLPRSGTSMMMRMLEAGGMEVLVDNIRRADEDNPAGYYEFEKAKKIKDDSSWLRDAEGKAFKMVSMLLRDLPPGREYRIIFMKRIMAEILASQTRMLANLGRGGGGASDEEMGRLFNKHLVEIEKWLEKQNNMDVRYFSYNDILDRPLENLQALSQFLDNGLDIKKMVNLVDRSLYRQRIKGVGQLQAAETNHP